MGETQPNASFFANAEYITPDAIFDVTKRFLADTDAKKVNVGAGTYRDENGKPWVLPSVRMAKKLIAECGHEYLPIAGLKTLREKATELVFHGTQALKEDRIANCQSLSGTGALHLAGLALKKANPDIKTVLITEPTWSNHELLFKSLGMDVQKLPYYKDRTFDFVNYLQALKTATSGSIIVLHTCAHNPTGCDPSKPQWKEIFSVIQERGLFPIFDSAYLGFKSGSVDDDAWPIRYFVEDLGLEAAIAMSFAKSMGLYGERVGLIAFVTSSALLARTMTSILENCQRATVSTPPVYGAQIAATVLSTPEIAEQWSKDLITMSGRILSMRQRLYDGLVARQTPGDWLHIVKQAGMFGNLCISSTQIQHLESKYHIYMADTSRISTAGLNEGNVDYFVLAVDETVKNVK